MTLAAREHEVAFVTTGGPGLTAQAFTPEGLAAAEAEAEQIRARDRAARIGEKPDGPDGIVLGPFGCLRGQPPEIVCGAVVGTNVGTRVPELRARERFRWAAGHSALDRAGLQVSIADFFASGLVALRLVDGARVWERVAREARPRRDLNLPPAPVRAEAIAVADTAADRLKAAELAALDARIDARIDVRLRERGA